MSGAYLRLAALLKRIRTKILWAAGALCTLTGCLSNEDGKHEAVQDLAALCRIEVLTQGLYGGKQSPRTVTLTDASRLSLVTVQPSPSVGNDGLCTGTLVADGWVLTAAHCVPDTEVDMMVRFGPKLSMPVLSLKVQGALVQTGYDAALLRLSTTGWSRLIGAQPIPIWSEPIPESWVGREVELAGRGLAETGKVGAILFASESVTAIHTDTVEVDGLGVSGACFGDSGGPLLVSDEDGVVYVAGTLTVGGSGCVGRDLYVRLDHARNWIMETMADHPVPDDDPCDGLQQ